MFVTFEGPDGAGKSTALRTVAEALHNEGFAVATTRQPGDSSIGLSVRAILLDGPRIEPLTELFLFLADRAQHVSEVIRPALNNGQIVLCDRYADSTIVYQGHARGLDLDALRHMNDIATGALRPDITLLLEIEPEKALRRENDRDRLDREPLEFHQSVLDGFRAEARCDPDRWVTVDASLPADRVAELCLQAIRQRIVHENRNN